ncbi:PP2C family protein-serine/threonine phosphatase [Algibacter sp. L1A34]|uniref:PP2C family protein-serine/threonine phosphatase n=1 Tax=Algibacter sp. L1A34 TaxID=2686365 RepID=UPI00131D2F8A|nr:PP2C family serine/threonine-protein phosphatase [Algibacter sp. L1A34]
MKSITLTHKGKRKTNQDVVLTKNINPDTYFYLVADGMGGYDNGEIAAQIVSDSILTFLSNVIEINKESIQKAINKANLAIRQFQEQNHSKMGATLGAVIFSKGIAKCFWVGDIKILHYSESKLTFESKSHNLKNELSKSESSNEVFKSSKYSHIVTRSIQGVVKKSIISYQEITIKEKDKLIICSDGVHGLIDSQTILFLMNNEKKNISFIDELNNRLENESNDNASLIYVTEFK